MTYDPNDYVHRTQLATALNRMLSIAGFEALDGPEHAEKVYRYKAIGGTEILVYSSIVGTAVRGDGEDAIRVAAVYRRRDGEVRGLFKDTRVNRTGEIDRIVTRTHERMRNAYMHIRDHFKAGMVCKSCGAPLFKSKNGNWTCAETCWVK